MKTLTFFVIILFNCNILLAQVLLNEDFSGEQWPPEGWTMDEPSDKWEKVSTSNAGGVSPEIRFKWLPHSFERKRLITPVINLSENGSSTVLLTFKHMMDFYSNEVVIGVEVRDEESEWTTAWSLTVSDSFDAEEKVIEIPAQFINSENFQAAIFFEGSSTNINYWYIDDISVLIPMQEDLAVSSVKVPKIFSEPLSVQGSVSNRGITPVNSFDLNWMTEQGDIKTMHFSSLEIPMGGSFSFETDQPLDMDPGLYDLSFFITNVNGQSIDDNSENDTITYKISRAHQVVGKLPLFEYFTSSGCPPCGSFNLDFFNEFSEQNKNKLVYIKYPINYDDKGGGDPYGTIEGDIRKSFYSIIAVPKLFFEGANLPLSGLVVTEAFEAIENKAYLDIEGYYYPEGDQLIIEGQLIPHASFWDVTAHVVAVEGTTFGNVGGNGETSFHHVMMKMLPDAYGSDISLSANQPFPVSYVHDMSGTFVEEMEDLKVVVFLQDNISKEIYQSAYFRKAEMDGFHSSSIDSDTENVDPYHVFTINFNQPVSNADGSEITEESLGEIISLITDGKQTQVDFDATIAANKMSITINPAEDLNFETSYQINIGPLSGIFDQEFEVNLPFTTRGPMGEPMAELNIEDQAQDIPVDFIITATYNQPVKMADGRIIDNDNVNELISLNKEDNTGENVPFQASVSDDKQLITINPDNPFDFQQLYFLEISAVMGVDGDVNSPIAISFTTENSTSSVSPESLVFKTYPNPAGNVINVEVPLNEGDALLQISDLSGRILIKEVINQEKAQVDISDLPKGNFILELTNGDKRGISRFSKIR